MRAPTRVSALLLCLLVVSTVSGVAQQPPSASFPPGTASIAGRVVAIDTGKPIPNAIVDIVIYENVSARFRQSTTDAQGRFEFTLLPAGHYQLAAAATRYVRMQFGQPQAGPLLNPPRTIELIAGQAFRTADFALSPFGAIEGVVRDEFGDPAPNVTVQVSQIQYAGGRRRLLPANSNLDAGPLRPTDDRGQFRIGGLVPGEYYVAALSGAFADPNAAGGFNVTYYPGTPNTEAARIVSVTPGHDALNVSFALVPAQLSAVAGTVVDGDGLPLPGATLMLVPSERAGTPLFMMIRSVAAEGGRFAFRNVPPGAYTIQAFGRPVGAGNLGASPFGYLTFAVDGSDTEHLTVKVPAPRTLRGHLTFEGAAAPPKVSDAYVSAQPIDFESAPIGGGGPSPMTVNEDWTFEVRAMSGLRVVTATVRPDWMLRRAMLDGRDVTDTPLDFREHDVNGLDLIMTMQTTTVTAAVTVPRDKTVSDYSLLVFAADESKWTLASRYVMLVRPGQQDRFTVKGLPAGSYVAVAVGAQTGGDWQDPAFLRARRANADAVLITLVEGESKTLQLRASQ